MSQRKDTSVKKSRHSSVLRILVIVAVAAVVGILWYIGKPSQETKPAAPADSASAFVPEPDVPASVEAVKGRWLREDGGYILEIREGRAGGHLEALYFNPRPIHVSRAAWMERAQGLQVFVELTDTGYPGATYMLTYDKDRDVLTGTYTQPTYQQEFQVEFVRTRE